MLINTPASASHSGTSEDSRRVLEAVRDRALAAGLQVHEAQFKLNDRFMRLDVHFPRDGSTLRVRLSGSKAKHIAKERFESIHFLGDYIAFWDRETGEIEACLTTRDEFSPRMSSALWNSLGSLQETPESSETNDDYAPFSPPGNWSFVTKSADYEIEFSKSSRTMEAVSVRGVSAKLRGFKISNYNDAHTVIDTYLKPLLFDIDLVHDLPIAIASRRYLPPGKKQPRPAVSIGFPKLKYSSKALDLYNYGRKSSGLPLLEFLAYYQTAEHFFPNFSQRALLNNVRQRVSDVRFNSANDADLLRLIQIVSCSGSGRVSEREQLRDVVRTCFSSFELEELIGLTPESREFLTTKNQELTGIDRIFLENSNLDLRDQIADRLYSIRCRIVHAKEDSGTKYAEALLPSSPEAKSLAVDIGLMREVARKALIAGANSAS